MIAVGQQLQIILYLTDSHKKPRQHRQGFNNIYAKKFSHPASRVLHRALSGIQIVAQWVNG